MRLLLFALSCFIGFPTIGLSATIGDDCRSTFPTTLNKTGISCKVLYDWTTDTNGAVISVPLTNTACHTYVYVRTATGTTPNYDDFKVVNVDTSAALTGQVSHVLGVLDNDGTVTAGYCSTGPAVTTCGVTLVHEYGPVLPYMFLAAGVLGCGAADCDMLVYLVQYECPAL